jgi:hypothetical protein
LTHVVVRSDAEIHARFDLGREKMPLFGSSVTKPPP